MTGWGIGTYIAVPRAMRANRAQTPPIALNGNDGATTVESPKPKVQTPPARPAGRRGDAFNATQAQAPTKAEGFTPLPSLPLGGAPAPLAFEELFKVSRSTLAPNPSPQMNAA